MKKRVPLMVKLTKFLVGFKLTPMGRIAVIGIFTSAIGGVTIEIPIYQIFCGMVCLFGVIETTGILLRPKLEVTSWLPDKVTAGESVSGFVTVKNLGWLPACDIMCALFGMPKGVRHIDADRSIHTIPSQQQATLPITIYAENRGDYVIPEARIHSTFPFNLMRFGKAKTAERDLRVLPKFTPLENLELPISNLSRGGNVPLEIRIGNSPEFIGNRDYISGEPVRRLDFKAWARVGRPVVREYQAERCANVAIILDTFQPRSWRVSRRERPQLEAAVSLTAAIAHQFDLNGSTIEAFMAGGDFYVFQPSSMTTHFESVLEVLSDVEITKHDPLPHFLPVVSESLESVATTVCVFIDWDEIRVNFVRELQSTGSEVIVFIVHERETSLPIAADAENIQVIDPRKILSGAVRSI